MIQIEKDPELESKEQEYLEYLRNHISGVQRSWREILLPKIRSEVSEELISAVDFRVRTHDSSKYSSKEFDAYRLHWYPLKDEVQDEKTYDLAVLHHHHNNGHHPQFWIIVRDSRKVEPQDMPLEYVLEMLCDWHSFTLKDPESTAYRWYQENKDKMVFSDSTREKVEKFIGYLKEPLK